MGPELPRTSGGLEEDHYRSCQLIETYPLPAGGIEGEVVTNPFGYVDAVGVGWMTGSTSIDVSRLEPLCRLPLLA
jgi:hypothetical protein